MNYEKFKISMAALVTNTAGKEVNVTLHQVPKNNGIFYDAITVMYPGENVAPSLYMQDFFDRYQGGESMENLAEEILYTSKNQGLGGKLPTECFLDFDRIKDRICYKLINREKNKKILESMPYLPVLDLAMVFYYSLSPDILDNASVVIRDTDMNRWNTTLEELIDLAKRNTPRLLPWSFCSIQQMMSKLFNEEDDVILPKDAFTEADPFMYILTNQEKYMGASCILYPELLSELSSKLDDDLYILPSSIHECILMPASGQLYSLESLSEMVCEINQAEVDATEVLADHAYYFNRKEKMLHM